MPPNSVVFHSTLAPEAVAEALLRSIDKEGVPLWTAVTSYDAYCDDGVGSPWDSAEPT